MFLTLFGIQISILGLIAVILGVAIMIILIWTQKTSWYVWLLWIILSIIWLWHFWIFQDVASLIDTSIFLLLSILGLIGMNRRKKKKGR